MNIILIIVLVAILIGIVSGYREVQVLIERGSWKWEDYRKQLYWFTNQISDDKDKDSFHVSNGFTFVLISMLESLVFYFALDLSWYWILIDTVIFWFGQFWIRNIWMHIISKKKPLWYYIIPIFGKLLKGK